MNNSKTKKNKNKKKSGFDKQALWDKFDNENNPKKNIECIYNSAKTRETCELCDSNLIYTDE